MHAKQFEVDEDAEDYEYGDGEKNEADLPKDGPDLHESAAPTA